MLTVKEALDNIAVVVSNARMTGPEHNALNESIGLVARRCEVADRFEAAAKAQQESQKEEKKDGPTNEPIDVSGINQEDS